jgi:hypothetical protein
VSRRQARATHVLLAIAALACPSLLVACAHAGTRASASRDELATWETRLAAAPECRVRLAPVAALPRSGASTGDATIVLRLVAFGTHELLDFAHVRVEPLDRATRAAARADSSGAMPAAFAFALPAGQYAVVAQSFGYQARTDTVAARAGTTDTVTIALEEYEEALRNAHNCRPHGFRHPGERACVTDQISAVLVLDRARDFASHRFRFGLGFPAGDSVDVNLVVDERICERAARIYGLEKGPPRRVVVVEAGNIYVVYDPTEPIVLGDLNEWLILDKRWKVLARMIL